MRVQFLLELARYYIQEDFLTKANELIKEALLIDYSTTKEKLQVQLEPDDDPSDFQRPFERLIVQIKQKLDMKLNIYGGPENKLEEIMADVENAKTTKNTYLRETLLDKVLNELMNYQTVDYTPPQDVVLVKEELEK